MLTNTALAGAVIESLSRDLRIPDSSELAISANRGLVTLCGTVESFNRLCAASEDADRPR